jgi:hypothetical protein
VTFLRRHVLHIEDYFASHYYRNVRCFDEYSNTPLEGTNNGVKHCTHGVSGNMPLRIASVNMVQQDADKLLSKKMSLHAELHKYRLCNLNEKGGSLITKNAFGQLKTQVEEGQNYASVRTGQTTWNIIRSTDRTKETILPVFERKRLVTWNAEGLLSCDCGYTKRWGMPCRHIAHVVEFYSNEKKCRFTHHDVDIRWWTIHAQLMVAMDANSMEPKEQEIRRNLGRIRELQQKQQYPIVHNLCNFHGVEFNHGKNSNIRFKNMSVDSAVNIFNTSKSMVLNYVEKNTCTGIVGLKNTVYLGDGDCSADNTSLADITSGYGTLEEDREDDLCATQQQLISVELESRKKSASRPVDPHEIFGPLYKEISLESKGDTIDELNYTKGLLESIINSAKARRAANTKTIKGKMVTCTSGNASKEHTRFKHKKQKFF